MASRAVVYLVAWPTLTPVHLAFMEDQIARAGYSDKIPVIGGRLRYWRIP